MYKLCKTEQSAARQRQLEEGLLLAMSTRQYETISVSDLCDQLGIPRKSFYRYFSGKDGALLALIDHTLLEFEVFAIPVQPGEKRSSITDLERFFSFWLHQKPLLDALQRSNLSGELVVRSVEHALEDVGWPSRFLHHEEKNARRYATTFGVCGLMSMVLDWHHGGYEMSPGQMASVAVQLLTEPLFSQKDS